MGSHSQDASGDAKMRALIAEGQILLAQGQTEAATESFLSENNTVTTEARLADGGNIQVTAQTLLRLRDSEITATVGVGSKPSEAISPSTQSS